MKFIQYKRAGLCLTAAAILLTGCGDWSEENAADRTLALVRAAFPWSGPPSAMITIRLPMP